MSDELNERTSVVRERIALARQTAIERQGCVNAELSHSILDTVRPTATTLKLLQRSSDRLALSPRVMTRLMKVARSIADLARCSELAPEHLAEAFELRTLDQDLLSCGH